MRRVFVDTWAWRALADRADPGHRVAGEIALELARTGAYLATTDYVLDETLTGLRRWIGAPRALAWLDEVQATASDGALDLVWLEPRRFDEAARLFGKLNGKFPRLSFTDCTSFVLMRDLDIDEAFTADGHFVRVGKFRSLVEQVGRAFRKAR